MSVAPARFPRARFPFRLEVKASAMPGGARSLLAFLALFLAEAAAMAAMAAAMETAMTAAMEMTMAAMARV